MNMSRDDREIDFETVRQSLINYLDEENLDSFRDIFMDLHNYEQGEI